MNIPNQYEVLHNSYVIINFHNEKVNINTKSTTTKGKKKLSKQNPLLTRLVHCQWETNYSIDE